MFDHVPRGTRIILDNCCLFLLGCVQFLLDNQSEHDYCYVAGNREPM